MTGELSDSCPICATVAESAAYSVSTERSVGVEERMMDVLGYADSDAADLIARINEEMEGVLGLIRRPVDLKALRSGSRDGGTDESHKTGVSPAETAQLLPN